jgi:hypothetical protein
MVNKVEPKLENSKDKQVPQSKKILVPSFDKEPDIKLSEINQDLVLNETDSELVDRICPHYLTLKNRYQEYRNPDPEGKNPDGFPLKIDRVHELAPLTAVLTQSVLSTIKEEVLRIVKCFVYEEDNGKEVLKPKMIIDKQVQGERVDGTPSTLASVRVGYYKYPMQFQQDLDGDWEPINNKFKKVWYLDWDPKYAEQLAVQGNPFTKKYAVWHPDTMLPINKKYYRKEEFFSMSDEDQIKDIENLPKNRNR